MIALYGSALITDKSYGFTDLSFTSLVSMNSLGLSKAAFSSFNLPNSLINLLVLESMIAFILVILSKKVFTLSKSISATGALKPDKLSTLLETVIFVRDFNAPAPIEPELYY